ncbi:MAG: hypothetical protein GX061_07315 [Eubacteriaceae bacterium]|nr:hypothetical protein [Eubacteriaceae bacterium]
MENEQDYIELDLIQIIQIIWKKFWIVAITSFLCAAIAFGGTYFFITPQYEAGTLLYVNNSSISVGSASLSISSGDLSAAKTLVNTYIVILKTRTTLNEVIKEAKLEYTYEQLEKMISAAAVNSTEVFEIVVTCDDPHRAERIANTIAIVLPDKISDIVEGSSVRIVDYAVVPARRSSPSYTKNTFIGFFLGVVLSVGGIIVAELFDTFIRNDQYLTQNYNLPLLAVIPDMNSSSGKKSYYYDSYESTTGKKTGRRKN